MQQVRFRTSVLFRFPEFPSNHMAVIETLTIGSDTYSVYALTSPNAVAETTTFWNGRLGAEKTAWDAAVVAAVDDEKRALVAAADWIDRALNFTGTKTVATQPRAWPRDNATNCGLAVAAGTTPDDMFRAQAWLAGLILVDNAATTSDGEGSNIKKVGADTATVQFFRPTDGTSADVRLPQVAHDYTVCYTEAALSGGIGGATSSGTDTESSFACDDFDLNEGIA